MKMRLTRCVLAVPLAVSMLGAVSNACAQLVLTNQSASLKTAITDRNGVTIYAADNKDWPAGDLGPMSLLAQASASSHSAKVLATSSLTATQFAVHLEASASFSAQDQTISAQSSGTMAVFFDVTKASIAAFASNGFNGGDSLSSWWIYSVDANGVETPLDMSRFANAATAVLEPGHYVFRGLAKTKYGAWMNRSSTSSAQGAYFDLTMTLSDVKTAVHGPAPTPAYFQQEQGPFAVSQTKVGTPVGFGGATVYYPSTKDEGPFGLVVITPGLLEKQSAISWLGPRLASHGFVVATLDTKSLFDFADARTNQTKAAIEQILRLNADASGDLVGRIDSERIAAMGHSTGSSLGLAMLNPWLRASIPLAPASSDKYQGTSVPTMIVSCQKDVVAPVANNANAFYDHLFPNVPSALAEIKGGGHGCTNSSTSPANKQMIGKYTLSWLKRFVDNDKRYSSVLCETPAIDLAAKPAVLSAYKSNCPF